MPARNVVGDEKKKNAAKAYIVGLLWGGAEREERTCVEILRGGGSKFLALKRVRGSTARLG